MSIHKSEGWRFRKLECAVVVEVQNWGRRFFLEEAKVKNEILRRMAPVR
jgi:hypothetical protein